jgi:hypothetical protein
MELRKLSRSAANSFAMPSNEFAADTQNAMQTRSPECNQFSTGLLYQASVSTDAGCRCPNDSLSFISHSDLRGEGGKRRKSLLQTETPESSSEVFRNFGDLCRKAYPFCRPAVYTYGTSLPARSGHDDGPRWRAKQRRQIDEKPNVS